ncbi:hypothetical protein [Chondrinema litorale]|uniref:hypothetical protein n=1 Tax=Chondrinema litorale TaxID=2994555 RepID=UPI002543D203|nr:hypothetical protein [Chondrinema litorale]UZR98096.1 hypothetical protein OQ292_30180 [Chondrinema litorale]
MNTQNKKPSTLLIVGVLLISFDQIVSHYVNMPDFFNGLLMGTGIGLLIMAVYKLSKLKVFY